MNTWLSILIPSLITGIICGYFIRHRFGIVAAGAIPWFGLLAVLLYNEYFVPYKGGGASMWPIAQLFAGTIMAAVGITAFKLTRKYIVKD
jgi:hypothetical protein